MELSHTALLHRVLHATLVRRRTDWCSKAQPSEMESPANTGCIPEAHPSDKTGHCWSHHPRCRLCRYSSHARDHSFSIPLETVRMISLQTAAGPPARHNYAAQGTPDNSWVPRFARANSSDL